MERPAVARDQNARSAKALDRREARLPQRFFLAAELFEDLADLSVCGVYEAHRPPHRANNMGVPPALPGWQ